MVNKNIYKLNEEELRSIIKEAVLEVINENQVNELGGLQQAGNYVKDSIKSGNGFMGISFGIVKRRQNRQNIFKFANEYVALTQKLTAIANELDRRQTLLQNASHGMQMNEGVGGQALKRILKPIMKTAAKTTTKKAVRKAVNIGGLATVGLLAFKVPQRISNAVQMCKNPDAITPVQLKEMYYGLSEWMMGFCEALKENPKILGADAIPQDLVAGYQQPTDSLSTGDLVKGGLKAASFIGISCIPGVGPIYDILDIVGTLASAKAETDEEALQEVGNMDKYLTNAVGRLNNMLAQSKNKSTAPLNKQVQTTRVSGSR